MITSPTADLIDPANNEKFEQLFSVLEELLKRIADTDDPDIRRKRAQVRAEMLAVKSNESMVEPEQPELTNSEDWGQQALVALAGAAVALSVFRHSS
jgi:hypothetical protein